MQGSAVVETASGQDYYSNGGSLQKDEPSNSKKECVLSCNRYNEARLIFLDDEWDSSPPEQRMNAKEFSEINKTDLWEPSFTASPDNSSESIHSPSSGFEDSIDYAFLNETYSIHYSKSKLRSESLSHLNLELDCGIQNRKEVFFDILQHQGNKTIGLERIFTVSDDYKENVEDVQKHDVKDVSQQEYHSAEEQDYVSNHLSFDQKGALTMTNVEVVGLRSSGCQAECASSAGCNHDDLESGSSMSVDSIDAYEQGDSTHISKFQNSVTLRECHESKHKKSKEQETSLMYHTVFDEIVLKSTPLESQESQSKSGFLCPQKALKTKICASKMKSQRTESEDFCGNAIIEKKMSKHFENPPMLPQDKALETLLQSCRDGHTSWTSVFDDSVISSCEYSHYKSLHSSPNQAWDVSVALPRVEVRGCQAVGDERALKVANGSPTSQMCPRSVEGRHPESVTPAASCPVTADQTVDVSADFRACFTASRATSARSPVVSRSSNTEITMINKTWPGEWQREKPRSVACNTDWSYSYGNEDTKTTVTRGSSGKSLLADRLKADENFLNKDSLELRKPFDNTDLKKHPKREFRLSQEVEQNLPSECCQKIMQRAINAELQLLNVHYQICRRHCNDIYKLVQSREGLQRNLTSNSAKKELGSALLSIWGDLKVRYVNLKEKIHKGIPLEELPPFSVESKLLSAFSTFASRLMKEDSNVFSGADSELDNKRTHDVDVSSNLKKMLSQMSLSSDNSPPKQDTLSKEDGFENGDIDVNFSQLKLDDKDSKNSPEISEDWFDAKENLTGIDFSGIQANQMEQNREVRTAESLRRDKGFLIHVGGLCPSVSEADLRSHFQKYQVSEISIYDSSTNYRYASLAFKKSSDAKMAVKEMNGRELNGKSVNVRLVKTPGEHASSLSSKNGNHVSLSNLEKSTSKEVNSTSSVSRMSRTRPRHLGSEQDSELFPFNQKGVKKNCKQIESAKLLPETLIQFIPPNNLNLRSFTKIMKRLAELHPEISRDHLIDALQKVRKNHNGFLNGLSINTIVEMTSSVLKNSDSS